MSNALKRCPFCGRRDRRTGGWMPMETAPTDGTLVLLLVEGEDAGHRTEDDVRWRTIGGNNGDNDGEYRWQFAGWSWEQDHFMDGDGTPVGWQPLPAPPSGAPEEGA